MKGNLSKRLLQGGVGLTAARLITRVFDLVRMLTIARWLGPQEMGVYAVASLVITAIDQLSETGLRTALIQRQGDISSYIVPARTVQVIRGVILGVAVYLSAPWIATFFNSPRSLEILRVIAVLPIIRGLEPLFLTIAQKELRFLPMISVQILSTFISLCVGIIAAVLRPDAWSMVWASLSGSLVTTIATFFLSKGSDLRLSLDWKPLRDLHKFSFWVFVNFILSYIFIKGGDWTIGRLLDVKELAIYQMAFLVSTIVTAEAGAVISQLAFPVFSHFQDQREKLLFAFQQAFGLISMVTFAMVGIVYACSKDFFLIALGPKWLSALPLVPWLSVWGACSVFAGVLYGVFYALGKPQLWVKTVIFMVCLLMVGIYPITVWQGSVGVAILMAAIGILIQIIRFAVISHILDISLTKIIKNVLIPVLACISSTMLTVWLRSSIFSFSPLMGLFFCLTFLPCIYLGLLFCGHRWLEPTPKELVLKLLSLIQRDKAVFRT